jgi:hypothetical protein
MKQFATSLPAALMLFMMSCNNQPKPAEEQHTTTDTVAKVTAPAAFTPYKAMMVQLTVKDFDKWLPVYKSNDSLRKANGITSSAAGQGLDNKKWVIVINATPDIEKAKAFTALPARKEAMKKAGVTGTPTETYYNVLRDDTSTIPQSERVMVTHHVKDFDAWLKVYDGEGKDTRAANGMMDRWLARGIDDPNTVTLLFAITDMAKAKARIAAPEMKKLMTDAGVDGAPKITYFKWVTQ